MDDDKAYTPETNREKALENVLRRIRSTREFPVISKYLIEINQKLSDACAYTTASELANTIIKDYALTNKLLKLVNSAFYGFVSGKVTTVSRAVILLGYETVRLAASSLVLFEHFQRKTESTDLKEAVIQSFWCGLIARDIAAQSRNIDAEEAFICAMLHQLGRLLVIFHLPDAYRAIQVKTLKQGLEEKKASKAVLGITYSTLGRKVAKLWGFPESLQNSMAPLPAAAKRSSCRQVDPLHALAVFVNLLGGRIATTPNEQFNVIVPEIHGRYGAYLDIDRDNLGAFIGTSLDNVEKHAEALQLGIGKSDFLQRLKAYIDSLGKPVRTEREKRPAEPRASFQLMDISATQAAVNPIAGNDPIAVLMEGLQEVTNAMAVDPDVNNIAMMSLEIIYRALRFNQVVLFIHDTARRTMEARFRYGRRPQRICENICFKMDNKERDIFELAISLSQDLVVEDSAQEKLRAMIPAWYHQHFNAPAFIFFPIMYKKVCLGAFYADRDTKGLPISKIEHRYTSMIRNQLVLALRFCK